MTVYGFLDRCWGPTLCQVPASPGSALKCGVASEVSDPTAGLPLSNTEADPSVDTESAAAPSTEGMLDFCGPEGSICLKYTASGHPA